MLNICTLSDLKYLDKGLTLINNLKKYYENTIVIHYLCLDVETKNTLDSLNIQNVKTYLPLGYKYTYAEQLPACEYGTQYSQFCWACCPIFIQQILDCLTHNDELVYVDSDILFVEHPDFIWNQIREKKHMFAVHSHRCEPTLEEWDVHKYDIHKSPVGFFNVGVVYLKNSFQASLIVGQWVDVMLSKPDFLPEYRKCGDQALLTYFALQYPLDVYQFDNIKSNIAHLAAWNTPRYNWIDEKTVEMFGRQQLLCFIHFSHFTPNYEENTWSSSYNGEWMLETNEHSLKYCNDYFELLKQSKKLIENARK